jgi:hypothetical protein
VTDPSAARTKFAISGSRTAWAVVANPPHAPRYRTVLGLFLGRDDLDAADLLEVQALRLLARLQPARGDVVYLLIDDTRIAKRGKQMAHLSKLWDHKQQRFITGHLVVTGAWHCRGVKACSFSSEVKEKTTRRGLVRLHPCSSAPWQRRKLARKASEVW